MADINVQPQSLQNFIRARAVAPSDDVIENPC